MMMLVRDCHIDYAPEIALAAIREANGSKKQQMLGVARLTIETANVNLDAHYASEHAGVSPGPHVSLSVSATGSGIEGGTMAGTFGPFFPPSDRAPGTRRGPPPAMGLARHGGAPAGGERDDAGPLR